MMSRNKILSSPSSSSSSSSSVPISFNNNDDDISSSSHFVISKNNIVTTSSSSSSSLHPLHWSQYETHNDNNPKYQRQQQHNFHFSTPLSYPGWRTIITMYQNQLHLIVVGWRMTTPTTMTTMLATSTLISSQRTTREAAAAVGSTGVYLYNLETNMWYTTTTATKQQRQQPPPLPLLPQRRSHHTITLLPNRHLWMFGGIAITATTTTTSQKKKYLNDVHSYSLSDWCWRINHHDGHRLSSSSGRPPSPRCDACALVRGRYVVVIGGRWSDDDDDNDCWDDVWLWDWMGGGVWSQPILVGVSPCFLGGRYGAMGLDNGEMIIWVGKYENDTTTTTTYNSGHKRLSSSKTTINNHKNSHHHKTKTIIIQRQLLDIKNHQWKPILTLPSSPLHHYNNPSISLSLAHYDTLITISDYVDTDHVTFSNVTSWRWTIPAIECHSSSLSSEMRDVQPSLRKMMRYLEIKRNFTGGSRNDNFANVTSLIRLCERTLATFLEKKEDMSQLAERLKWNQRELNSDGRTCHVVMRIASEFYLFTGDSNNGGNNSNNGWSSGGGDDDVVIGADVLLVLHLDLPGECERRMNECLYARWEQSRHQKEQAEAKRLAQIQKNLQLQKSIEKQRQIHERQQMSFEDELSHLPPKTIPPQIRLKLATKRMIVVCWNRVTVDSQGNNVGNIDDVEYRLMVRGGMENFERGMKVWVVQRQPQQDEGNDDDDDLIIPSDYLEKKRAIIIKKHSHVLFDVQYMDDDDDDDDDEEEETNDGSNINKNFKCMKKSAVNYDIVIERFVKWQRIVPCQQREWSLVFAGCGVNEYAYEAISAYTLEQDPQLIVSADFVLYTLGTEIPRHEPSRLSEPQTFSTVNNRRRSRSQSNNNNNNNDKDKEQSSSRRQQRGDNRGCHKDNGVIVESYGRGRDFF